MEADVERTPRHVRLIEKGMRDYHQQLALEALRQAREAAAHGTLHVEAGSALVVHGSPVAVEAHDEPNETHDEPNEAPPCEKGASASPLWVSPLRSSPISPPRSPLRPLVRALSPSRRPPSRYPSSSLLNGVVIHREHW